MHRRVVVSSLWMMAIACAPMADAPRGAEKVIVAAKVEGADAHITGTRGQSLRFESYGEIRLSFNRDDTASPSGSNLGHFSGKAPLPTTPAGALIGRVNNGAPFPIGNTTEPLQMPAPGTLFLTVNDDQVADNSGNFVVKVSRP